VFRLDIPKPVVRSMRDGKELFDSIHKNDLKIISLQIKRLHARSLFIGTRAWFMEYHKL